jgi:hypothetical protein
MMDMECCARYFGDELSLSSNRIRFRDSPIANLQGGAATSVELAAEAN